jgi:hypothetical protein
MEKIILKVRNLKFQPRLHYIFSPSVLLRGVRWFKTDVSGLPVGPV